MSPDLAAEASAGGVVEVAGRAFPVVPLSAAGERALARALDKLAKSQDGPGSVFAREAALLDYLRKNAAAEWQVVVREFAALKSAGGGADLKAAEESPAGVALQLYHRSRPAVPGLKLSEVEAIVTAANADDVLQAMEEAVTAAHKSAAAG